MSRTLCAALALAGGLALVAGKPGVAGESGAVTYIEAAQVTSAFAKGAPLVEMASYKIHASRREKPGLAEIHTLDTDILYVLDGRATVVTGGSVADSKTIAPGEIRGAEIRGGETRQLVKGDVLVVPHGTPHWFKEVTAPFLYYVVKVTAGAEAKS